MSYSYLATMRTQPGRRDEVTRALAAGAPALAAYGCLLYLVNTAPDDEDGVVVYEVWTSKQHHDDSLRDTAVRASITDLKPLLTAEFTGRELSVVGGLGL